MENELVTTEVRERIFLVFFEKIKMHEDLTKLSEILERRRGVFAKTPIRNFGEYDLRIYFEKDRDVVTITLIKPMPDNKKQILASNFYEQKEIIQFTREILPSWVKTQYLLWKEDII